jgi:hypothetical protein
MISPECFYAHELNSENFALNRKKLRFFGPIPAKQSLRFSLRPPVFASNRARNAPDRPNPALIAPYSLFTIHY